MRADAPPRSCLAVPVLPLEGTLLEKLRKIQALHAGTTVDGEREPARRAAERIRHVSPSSGVANRTGSCITAFPIRGSASCSSPLCRRYGLKPFRQAGRRYSTVQLRAPKVFQEQTLWPEFLALSEELHAHLDELTTRVIREAIDEDISEPTDQAPPKALPAP
jgi:hypothetical protein